MPITVEEVDRKYPPAILWHMPRDQVPYIYISKKEEKKEISTGNTLKKFCLEIRAVPQAQKIYMEKKTAKKVPNLHKKLKYMKKINVRYKKKRSAKYIKQAVKHLKTLNRPVLELRSLSATI